MAVAGPMSAAPLAAEVGEVVERQRFVLLEHRHCAHERRTSANAAQEDDRRAPDKPADKAVASRDQQFQQAHAEYDHHRAGHHHEEDPGPGTRVKVEGGAKIFIYMRQTSSQAGLESAFIDPDAAGHATPARDPVQRHERRR